MTVAAQSSEEWEDAALAAALFAVDPFHLYGIWMRARSGPVRDRWLELVKSLLPAETPLRKLPLNASDENLFGGPDLIATLRGGRTVYRTGLLHDANAGVLLIPTAERLPQSLCAQLGAVLDNHGAVTERERPATASGPMLAIVAFDESETDDVPEASILRERLAVQISFIQTSMRNVSPAPFSAGDVASARDVLRDVSIPGAVLAGICQASIELGIASLRGPLFAAALSRACAALHGRTEVTPEDAAIAARYVLAPRAVAIPASQKPEAPGEEASDRNKPNGKMQDRSGDAKAGEISDLILASVRAVLPPNLLASLPHGSRNTAAKSSGGRSGVPRVNALRGRPRGVRRARGNERGRIGAVDTIRAAAPWQPFRIAEANPGSAKFHVRQGDIRIRRYKSFAQTTTIFVVDASGSAALQRLPEAKGAVELLLGDCYVRRDQVALIAFRGHEADILLPPTRSLVRAKKALSSLAGGGATPLAAGIGAAAMLAQKTRRTGGSPLIVLLTDGKANISANGEANREAAGADALKACRLIRKGQFPSLLVDTSPRPQPKAAHLAREMGALYLPLPYADARSISAAARSMAAA